MLRWGLTRWLITSAAAAGSLLGIPAVCGEEARPSVGKLLIDIESDEAAMRKSSAEALAASKDSRSIGALIAAMKDQDADVRRAAMLGLWRVGRPAFDRLILALCDDDHLVRRGACEALGLMEDHRAVLPIIDCLSDSSPEVRSSAAWALGRLRKPPALRPLIVALRDDWPQVRREAAWALGELKDTQAVEPLVYRLRDFDNGVRNSAASALAELRDPRAVQPLLVALKDDDVATRRQSARALGCLADAGACEGLITALSDLDAIVRESAARALGRIEDSRAVSTLIEVLGDEDAQVRKAATEALVAIGKPSVKPLNTALESENPLIRIAAKDALNRWRELHVGDTIPVAAAETGDAE